MATRTIQSPGVEIRERDLSLTLPQNVGTNVFVAGFANQGPTDEVLKVSSRDELEQIYGTPTNSSERYFYYTLRELLNSPANIYTFRLPYGEASGDGFGTQYSALVYPVRSYVPTANIAILEQFDNTITGTLTSAGVNVVSLCSAHTGVSFKTLTALTSTLSAAVLSASSAAPNLSSVSLQIDTAYHNSYFTINNTDGSKTLFQYSSSAPTVAVIESNFQQVTTNLDLSAAVYVLGEPVHVNLTETEYANALEGTMFEWSKTGTSSSAITSTSAFGGAGVIVLDKAQTTINSQFEGYYIGIADNTNMDPASNFDSILRANTLSLTSNYVGNPNRSNYTQIPTGTLQFNLSSTYSNPNNSISQIIKSLTDYNIDGREDDDLLSIGVFKVRKSIYATESFKLDFVVDDAIVGSVDSFRTELNPNGGPSVSFFLESKDENSRNVEILVNPYISNKFTESSLDSSGIPRKKIRVLTQSLINTNSSNYQATGITTAALSSMAASIGYADALYPLGAYTPTVIKQKIIGNVPTKINRALESVKNDEVYDIDVVVEAGLGTIFTMACAAQTQYYDDTLYTSTLKAKVDSLRTSNDISLTDGADLRANYSAVFNQFENFCNLPSNTGGRGDCIFVADVLRHILVTGRSNKILSDKNKNFQQHVYWAMRHQLELENTSYATVYGNWVQIYEEFSGEKIWAPFSGYAAATMARTDANFFPWIAPAGFNRGLLTTSALDIAITPNQKQRDELYKSNINPVTFNANDGFVIMGQKTLSRKPSSFDRINVRRLFLALERPTKKVSKYFVFEPNTEFTRTRFINTLTPLFENAKNNEGIYDYILVCDERNNTPEVIDANELKLDAFVKATRAAEYILVTFTSTRTDADFQELI
jgi:phage tail sheath protein FI